MPPSVAAGTICMSAGDLFFIDTNVLVYRHDTRDQLKQRSAATWLDRVWEARAGRVSWQVLHEFYVSTVRIGAPVKTIRNVLETYCEWVPVDFSRGLIQRAWYWVDRASVSYWDGLILGAAERAGCRWLLSEDFQAGREYGEVVVVNPFRSDPKEFL